MTHIIIPIEEIEKQLNFYQKAIKIYASDRTEEGKSKFMRFTGKYSALDKVYKLGKKVSLSEQDMQKQAEKAFPQIGKLTSIYDDADNDLKVDGVVD